MDKKLIKDKINLSAQDYAKLSLDEKKAISDEDEQAMKKLWPQTFKPKPLTWRRK